MLEILVTQTVILRPKNEGHLACACRSYNLACKFSRGLAVFSVKSGSASCSNHQSAVGNCFPYRVVAFHVPEYISAMDGHSPRPKTPGSCLAYYGQLGLAHIFHRPRDGTDVPRAARSYQDDADIGQHDDASTEFCGRIKAVSAFGERAQLVFLDDAAVLVVEFRSVAQVFVHDGCTVVNVLGAEDVGKLMNQSNNVECRIRVRAHVME